MPAEITMPQLSDTMTEGTVIKWLKKEGDRVKEGEIIAEIETDKANMEFESDAAGTVAALVVPEGAKAAVGAVIAVVASGDEKAQDLKKQYASGAAPARKEGAAGAGDRGRGGGGGGGAVSFAGASVDEMREPDESEGHAPARHTAAPAAEAAAAPQDRAAPEGDNGERVRVSPLARRIAREHGVDLAQLQGSGPGGRIVKEDVLAAAEGRRGAAPSQPAAAAGAPAAPAAAQPAPGAAAPALPHRVARGERQAIPLTKMRATIAHRLQQAKQQIPHIYLSVDVDMEAVGALRERMNQSLAPQGLRLSLADYVTKAVAVALVRHPALNAHFDAAAGQVIRFGDVHLGIAVALPDGLIVPVLRNADQMGLSEIRQRSGDLFERAKAQRLKRDELSGATFSITNLGQWGVAQFDAIINPPEVGILAVSAAQNRPVVRDGQLVAGTVMTLTLSADHRAIDGAVAAEFLRTLKMLLEEPAMMLV